MGCARSKPKPAVQEEVRQEDNEESGGGEEEKPEEQPEGGKQAKEEELQEEEGGAIQTSVEGLTNMFGLSVTHMMSFSAANDGEPCAGG